MTTAREALAMYGYQEDHDGIWRNPRRPRGQRWKPAETGGWLRYDLIDGQEVPVPHSVAEPFKGVSGLDPQNHPHSFRWDFPEEEVAAIYATAAREIEPSPAPIEAPPEALTEEQIFAMLEAQGVAATPPTQKRRWFGRG